MDTKEGRIILLGMILGTAAGGAAVMVTRMRGSYSDQQSVKQAVSNLSWAEVFSIVVATVTLAKRVAALSEPVAEVVTDK